MAYSSMLPRVIVLACAGIGTFYAAAQWTRAQRDDAADLAVSAPAKAAPTPTMPASAPVLAFAPPTTPAPVPGAVQGESDREPALSLTARMRAIPESKGDAFASLNWQPPPPPPPPPVAVKAVAPPPPPPPVLPFTFVGMLEQGSAKPSAFLSHGDALLVVSAGDLIENRSYRVESLTPTQIVLTQLATNVQHTINVSWGTK